MLEITVEQRSKIGKNLFMIGWKAGLVIILIGKERYWTIQKHAQANSLFRNKTCSEKSEKLLHAVVCFESICMYGESTSNHSNLCHQSCWFFFIKIINLPSFISQHGVVWTDATNGANSQQIYFWPHNLFYWSQNLDLWLQNLVWGS